jgi:hypothetical protein
VVLIRGREVSWTPVRAALDDVGDWIACVRHDVLEMKMAYFSMDAVLVENERPTTRSYLSKSQEAIPLGNGEAGALVEPVQLAKYRTSVYIPRR